MYLVRYRDGIALVVIMHAFRIGVAWSFAVN